MYFYTLRPVPQWRHTLISFLKCILFRDLQTNHNINIPRTIAGGTSCADAMYVCAVCWTACGHLARLVHCVWIASMRSSMSDLMVL